MTYERLVQLHLARIEVCGRRGPHLKAVMQSAPKMREYGAEIVPIGLHVDDFDHLVYRLLLLQGFAQRICGETAGASFGGEQLDDNRLARARSRVFPATP